MVLCSRYGGLIGLGGLGGLGGLADLHKNRLLVYQEPVLIAISKLGNSSY